jgi:hypothetical protein
MQLLTRQPFSPHIRMLEDAREASRIRPEISGRPSRCTLGANEEVAAAQCSSAQCVDFFVEKYDSMNGSFSVSQWSHGGSSQLSVCLRFC